MIWRFGMREDLPDARLEVEDAGGSVEFLEHRVEDRSVCAAMSSVIVQLQSAECSERCADVASEATGVKQRTYNDGSA